MWRTDSFEKTLMLGKIEGRRKRGRQRMRWLDGISDSMDMGMGGHWELVMDRKACCGSWIAKSWTWLSDWTELNNFFFFSCATMSPLTWLSASHFLKYRCVIQTYVYNWELNYVNMCQTLCQSVYLISLISFIPWNKYFAYSCSIK